MIPTTDNRPRPSYARWRALSLIGVHVLVAAHIAHWKVNGRTLAPLELNELMYTLEAGIITAGFLFMVLVCVSVLVVGRFFCSWGCHILALQDLCSWIMVKFNVRPRVVRAKALLLVPIGAMLYMFVWPQVQFLLFDVARPALHTTGEESGWASFVTSDFWRNLPPPGIALATFAVCGFGIVYLMGDRSFCKYACPYGAIFSILERFAPGRISKTGDCSACGLCTASCQSDIRVHEELAAFGQVVDSACLRDLDCLNACPDGAIGFRFQKPKLLGGALPTGVKESPPRKPMFSRNEEWGMALAYLPLVLVLRGLYGLVPFLMALALAGMLAYLGLIFIRLLREPAVKLVRFRLKTAGRLRTSGRLLLAGCTLLGFLIAHSAFIQAHAWSGHRVVESLGATTPAEEIDAALRSLGFVERWGLLSTPGTTRDLGRLNRARGEQYVAQGDYPAATRALLLAVESLPGDPVLHFNLGRLLSQSGRTNEAIQHYRACLQLTPEDPEALNNLAYMLLERGEYAEAEGYLRTAIRVAPSFPHAHFNLGRVLFETGRDSEGMNQFQQAANLDPSYAEWFAEFQLGG